VSAYIHNNKQITAIRFTSHGHVQNSRLNPTLKYTLSRFFCDVISYILMIKAMRRPITYPGSITTALKIRCLSI